MPHQDLVFTNPTPGRQSPSALIKIYKRKFWTGSWTEVTGARLNTVTWACAPSIGRAQFSRRYGYGMQPGESLFGPQDPLAEGDILGWFVKIEIRYIDDQGQEQIGHRWYGVAEMLGDKLDGPTPQAVPAGDQAIMCYGLEYLLTKHRIQTSRVFRPAGPEYFTHPAGLAFNQDGRGNRSVVRENNAYQLIQYYGTEATDFRWSSNQIFEYLINSGVGVPRDEGGTVVLPFEYNATELSLPTWDAPEVETHNVTTAQVLNRLADRRRLYTWFVEPSADESKIWVKVKTFTDSDITITTSPLGVIPANPDTVTVDYSGDATVDAVLQSDVVHRVDQVIATGAKRTATIPARIQLHGSGVTDRPLVPAWTEAQEALYELAGSDSPDYPPEYEVAARRDWHAVARSSSQTRAVYRVFKLNPDLDWDTLFDPLAGTKTYFGGLQILPTTRLIEGKDYEDVPVADIAENTREDAPYLPITPISDLPSNVAKQLAGDPITVRYVRLDAMAKQSEIEQVEIADVRDWSINVSVSQGGRALSLDVMGAPQHTIATGHFTPRTEDLQEHGEWDVMRFLMPLTVQEEKYAEGRWPADNALPQTDAVRTIRVDAGWGYRHDIVHKDTAYGIDSEGLATLVFANDDISTAYVLRDDSEELEAIAKGAFQWYGTTRRAIRVRGSWDTPAEGLGVGKYLTTVTQVANDDLVVNAMISQFTIEAAHGFGREVGNGLQPLKYSMQTAFGELDFVRLKGVSGAA